MAFISSKKSFLKSAAANDMDELNYCLTYMIPSRFSIDVKNADGKTALYLAAENGQLEAVKALLEKKADTEIAHDSWTPLLIAVNEGKTAVARALIAAGADVNAHNDSYVTAIIPAARLGQLDVVQDLAAAKADLNAVSKSSGRTGLHWAVENGHGPIVEFLLAQNVRTDIVDRKGKTALQLAQAMGLTRIIAMFGKEAEAPQLPAPAAAPAASPEAGESWVLLAPNKVAHVGNYEAINRKITEIFNFASRERLIITENLKTGAESVTPPEKFDTLPDDAVRAATEALARLSGPAEPKKSFNL